MDRALEVMDEYQDKIHPVEHDGHGLDTLRSVHILAGDPIMHQRTLDSFKILSVASGTMTSIAALRSPAILRQKQGFTVSNGASGVPKQEVQGYLSYQTKLYLVWRTKAPSVGK
ncbi:hypothetical protein E4T56_gene11911 [Termitomyces sp. T112]|nr:hypothetical protein E4T56_gene11911 [Termitomyces sp. T112]